MKILASRADGPYSSTPDTFIVEISLDEIKKVANKAGYRDWSDENTKKLLAPGNDYPIAEGYDFRRDIVNATQKMGDAYSEFAKAAPTMHRFVALIGQQPSGDESAGEA